MRIIADHWLGYQLSNKRYASARSAGCGMSGRSRPRAPGRCLCEGHGRPNGDRRSDMDVAMNIFRPVRMEKRKCGSNFLAAASDPRARRVTYSHFGRLIEVPLFSYRGRRLRVESDHPPNIASFLFAAKTCHEYPVVMPSRFNESWQSRQPRVNKHVFDHAILIPLIEGCHRTATLLILSLHSPPISFTLFALSLSSSIILFATF